MKLMKLNKKLLLLLSMPLMAFQCEPELTQPNDCNCIQDNFIDNGFEMVILPSEVVNMQLCNESESEAVVHIKGTPYWYALRVECE
jgi:hypothetical protein